MSNFIPREINIDRSEANRLIICNGKKDLALSDYAAIFVTGFIYVLWIYLTVRLFLSDGEIILSKVVFFVLLLLLLAFNTRLLISLIISLREKQSIIITEKFIEIIKERPFFSKHYKIERAGIRQINLEVFGFMSLFLPSAITSFKYHCNLKYYEAPRIVHKDGEVYILEHFRHKVRKWIIDELHKEIK